MIGCMFAGVPRAQSKSEHPPGLTLAVQPKMRGQCLAEINGILALPIEVQAIELATGVHMISLHCITGIDPDQLTLLEETAETTVTCKPNIHFLVTARWQTPQFSNQSKQRRHRRRATPQLILETTYTTGVEVQLQPLRKWSWQDRVQGYPIFVRSNLGPLSNRQLETLRRAYLFVLTALPPLLEGHKFNANPAPELLSLAVVRDLKTTPMQAHPALDREYGRYIPADNAIYCTAECFWRRRKGHLGRQIALFWLDQFGLGGLADEEIAALVEQLVRKHDAQGWW